MLELGGWVLAVGASVLAWVARYRISSLTDAVARTCHELRGPLTAARLGLALAFRGGEPAEGRLKALELELSCATLALDDLARIQGAAGEMPAPPGAEMVDVKRLLRDAVEACRGLAIANGIGLRLRGSSDAAVVRGHRLRLAQAVCNLIANGIEHGGGVVQVSYRTDAGVVEIEVVDEGAGLPAPLSELVRQSRYRGAGSRRGHGLAIASGIAAAHGGQLAAVPTDRGTRLVLELAGDDRCNQSSV